MFHSVNWIFFHSSRGDLRQGRFVPVSSVNGTSLVVMGLERVTRSGRGEGAMDGHVLLSLDGPGESDWPSGGRFKHISRYSVEVHRCCRVLTLNIDLDEAFSQFSFNFFG